MKGYKHTEETKEKMRLAKIGKVSPHKGKTGRYTPETLLKMRIAKLGTKQSDKTKMKRSETMKGNNFALGYVYTLEQRMAISKQRKGRKLPPKSGETKKKISLSLTGRPSLVRGEKSHFWRGGIANDPYPYEWTELLKESIRMRDGYSCRLCNEPQKRKNFAVHHIDYNKNNCDPNNLVTLCDSCHSKTNFERERWQKLLTQSLLTL